MATSDWRPVRRAIAKLIKEKNCAPILVRLAWHASGTYDKSTGTGGSDGATMRFPKEAKDGANSGLDIARNLLEPIKEEFPWASYADIWTFAGAVAIEESGGPKILWRAGRGDAAQDDQCPQNGRLPDADKGDSTRTARHVQYVFNRMGFNDRETVALIGGGHSLGKCRTDRSGYSGPWTPSPFTFSNDYFELLTQKQWKKKEWSGPDQYEDETGELMMLPSDMAMLWDENFKPHVDEFAASKDVFFQEFADAFAKLLELGCSDLQGVNLS